MKNERKWQPSKFVRNKHDQWIANPEEVSVSSLLITNIVAKAYSDLIFKHARGRLLDLGCGAVPLYGMYRPFVDEIHCVDWVNSKHNALHIDRSEDLNADFDLGDACFDTIIATDIIEHLSEPGNFFRSAARALQIRGHLIVGTPFMYWIHEAPHDFHRYTRFALERQVKNAGLTCVSLEEYGGGPEVLADLLVKSASTSAPLAKLTHYTLSALLQWRFVRSLSERSKGKIPLGYVLVATKES